MEVCLPDLWVRIPILPSDFLRQEISTFSFELHKMRGTP
jgi:hypothetical protein